MLRKLRIRFKFLASDISLQYADYRGDPKFYIDNLRARLRDAFDYDGLKADPWDVYCTRFTDIQSYNAAYERHTLPDPDQPCRAFDEGYYTGFEPATELPTTLNEQDAKQWFEAMVKMHDYISSTCRVEGSPYKNIMDARFRQRDTQSSRAVFSRLEHRTYGNLSSIKSDWIDYSVRLLLDQNKDKAVLRSKLKRLGVIPEAISSHGRPILLFRPAHYYYKTHSQYAFADLVRACQEQIPEINYLEFLMAAFDGTKPQYRQPQLLFMGDAIDQSASYLPECRADFKALKDKYHETGLADAMKVLRQRVREYQALQPSMTPTPD